MCLKIFRSYNNNTLSIFMIHKVVLPTWGSKSTLKSRVAQSTDRAGQVSPDSIFNMCSLLMEKNCSISIIFKSVSYIYSLPRVNKTWQMSIYVFVFFLRVFTSHACFQIAIPEITLRGERMSQSRVMKLHHLFQTANSPNLT